MWAPRGQGCVGDCGLTELLLGTALSVLVALSLVIAIM